MFKRLSTLVAVGIVSMSLVACDNSSSNKADIENPQKIEENITEKLFPDQIAIKFATLKAKSVKPQYNDNTIIVGYDTVGCSRNVYFCSCVDEKNK